MTFNPQKQALNEILIQASIDGLVLYVSDCIWGGVDINYQDQDGQTALHKAVIWERDEIVELLLDHGANIDIKDHNKHRDNKGYTALDYASVKKKKDILNLLLDHKLNQRKEAV